MEQADQAMIRAAARAKALAASTNTPIHIMKDGKIVEIRPEVDSQPGTAVRSREEQEFSIVREDSPPYGGERP